MDEQQSAARHLYGSARSGAGLCHPGHPNMEVSLYGHNHIQIEEPKWLESFLQKALGPHQRDLPRPTMYLSGGKRLPCFTGGLRPPVAQEYREDFEWIYLKTGKYKYVHFKKLLTPSDAEYDLHFRKIIESNQVALMAVSCPRFKELTLVNIRR